MGQLFARLFRAQGAELKIADLGTALSPRAAAADADITLIAVPIEIAISLITEVAPVVRKQALLMDVTSLKTAATQAMLKYSDPEVEVIGTHPLFGPYPELSAQVIALTPLRAQTWLPRLERICRQAGLIPVRTTPEQHDACMSVVQVLLHVMFFSMIGTVQRLQMAPAELKLFSTPLYKLVWMLAERILGHDSKLYQNIALGNPYSVAALDAFIKVFTELRDLVARGDGVAFEHSFRSLGQFVTANDSAKDVEIERLTQLVIDFFSQQFAKSAAFKTSLASHHPKQPKQQEQP